MGFIADVKIPDSKMAKEAADLLKEHGSTLLWNHSHRVSLFGAIQGKEKGLIFDHELLYISALFHDLGLTKKYSSADKRFEVDGANAARSFLRHHGIDEGPCSLVWDAIAPHTTIGIAQYKEPEVVLLNSGVSLDVVGNGYENLSSATREQIVQVFPRNNFKKEILPAFLEGFKHKPETTYGNINADVCEMLLPGFKRKISVNLCYIHPGKINSNNGNYSNIGLCYS